MKNAFSSGSSKSQMLPSWLPFSASIFKVLPFPQKFNRFQSASLPEIKVKRSKIKHEAQIM